MLKLVFLFISNSIALLAAKFWVQGFEISLDPYVFLSTAAIFTAINFFIRPILKLVLSPLIVLTLGMGIIVVNALMLYVLDFLAAGLTIDGIIPLLYAAVIVSVISFGASFLTKITRS